MDSIEIKNTEIVWTLKNKKIALRFRGLVRVYLLNINPHNNQKLTTEQRNKIMDVLKICGGANFSKLIKEIKYYKPESTETVQKNVRNGRLLGSGRYAKVYEYGDYAIKMIKHKHYKNMPTLTGKVEYDIMRYSMNEILLNRYSPCILTMFQYIPTSKVDYIVMERLDCTLWDYIHNKPSVSTLKVLIFQVIFTIMIMYKKMPGFRHNDLKIDNILMDYTPRNAKLTFYYRKSYWTVNKGIPLVKIGDFDYACIPKKIDNPKVITEHSKSFGCSEKASDIYDLHIFLNSLYGCKNYLPVEIKKWIAQHLPTELRGDDNKNVHYGRLRNPEKWEKIIERPLELLKSSFFDELITKKPTYPLWGLKS